MQNVHPDSLPQDVMIFVRNLAVLFGGADTTRVVRTVAGYPALIAKQYRLLDSDELKITLSDNCDSDTSIAVLLAYPGITESELEQSISELADVSELIAIPANIAPQSFDTVLPVGEIQQRLDTSFDQVFLLLKSDPH
jgi:hypothetical protein